MTVALRHGDCLDVLASMPDASVDSIVTDPPYLIGFMGKGWDAADGIAGQPEVWAECLRVLKPGGHLLAFGATRTYHRMTVAIEDAGFDIRDSLHWLYGSGFPKSLDVSKAIDKMDAADEQEKRRQRFTKWVRSTGLTSKQIDEATGTNMGGHYTTAASQPAIMTREHLEACRHLFGKVPRWVEQECDIRSVESRNFAEREVVGKTDATVLAVAPGEGRDRPPVELDITAPATDAARQWSGWGTALKPAHEPIVVARKPLVGTVAGNVLAYGTGALNIDGCRVGSESTERTRTDNDFGLVNDDGWTPTPGTNGSTAGRWPANLVFTHAADCADVCADGCPVAELDGQSGNVKSGIAVTRNGGGRKIFGQPSSGVPVPDSGYTDTGGASRFFTVTEWDPITDVPPFRYVAKPSKRERNAGLDGLPEIVTNEATPPGTAGSKSPRAGANRNGAAANHHPTVKPVALMRWLVRLVTPPGGTVLDPFLGSGTTLVAAVLEGFDAIGIEMTDDYLPIIEGRVKWAEEQADKMTPTLFDDAGQGVRVTSLAGASIDPTGDATPGQGQV